MKKNLSAYVSLIISAALSFSLVDCLAQTRPAILDASKLRTYVDYFNATDSEYVRNYIPNEKAFSWLSLNVPLFECPDTTLEKIYYYRWWCFRKHLKQTPDG